MRLDLNPAILNTLLKTTSGSRFYGIVAVNSVLRTQSDYADYLVQVNNRSFVVPGFAIIWNGDKFILGQGVTEEASGPLFRSMRMITVSHELAWTRRTTTNEPISNLPVETVPEALGIALCQIQTTTTIADAFHSQNSKYLLVTNSPVLVDDHLGPYIVTFVEKRHGLFYGEVR